MGLQESETDRERERGSGVVTRVTRITFLVSELIDSYANASWHATRWVQYWILFQPNNLAEAQQQKDHDNEDCQHQSRGKTHHFGGVESYGY